MNSDTEESTEHFFTSFTDLLVGVIFLFIILLTVFALNLKQPKPKPQMTSEQVRAMLLTEISNRMKEKSLPVSLDLNSGVVRLPESLLFASGQWTLSPQGEQIIAELAFALREILPCTNQSVASCGWASQRISLDSVLIEGHTDSRPFSGPQGFGNWELSALRAITVYRTMTAAAPELERAITNRNGEPLLGVSAYADSRPVDATQLDPNRRIDVRFNMRANYAPQDAQP